MNKIILAIILIIIVIALLNYPQKSIEAGAIIYDNSVELIGKGLDKIVG